MINWKDCIRSSTDSVLVKGVKTEYNTSKAKYFNNSFSEVGSKMSQNT